MDNTDNERERAAPVCLYSPAPVVHIHNRADKPKASTTRPPYGRNSPAQMIDSKERGRGRAFCPAVCVVSTPGKSPKQTGGAPFRLDVFRTYSQSVDFLFIEADANRNLPPFRAFLACFWPRFGRIRANAAPPRLLIPIFARPAVLLRLLIVVQQRAKGGSRAAEHPRRVEAIPYKPPNMDNARKRTPRPPRPYLQQNRQTESLNHTKTAARLWKAARPRPFFWRVSSFRPLRRYIVSPAPYRAAVGKRPKASTKRDPPRPMQYRRGRRVEANRHEQEIQHRRGRTCTIQTRRQKPRPYGSAPRGGIRYAAPRGDHTPRP